MDKISKKIKFSKRKRDDKHKKTSREKCHRPKKFCAKLRYILRKLRVI